MSFQLKAKESVGDGLKRNVTRELEKVIDHAGAKPNTRAGDEAVHEIRKCFKRVRAALRVMRQELGDDLYREENFGFRDGARPLTEVRDAEMLVDTFDKLAPLLADGIDSEAKAKVRASLVSRHEDVSRRVLVEDRALVGVKDVATGALERVPAWRLERDGWDAVESGLRRVYRMGHRALAAASQRASVENLHEWRKQAKYLWHELQLVEPACTGREKGLADRAHELSQLLGDDHDLAVLREVLAADPLSYGGHRVLKSVFVVVETERAKLQKAAFALGRDLYADAPKAFVGRIEAGWTKWVRGPGPAPRGAKGIAAAG